MRADNNASEIVPTTVARKPRITSEGMRGADAQAAPASRAGSTTVDAMNLWLNPEFLARGAAVSFYTATTLLPICGVVVGIMAIWVGQDAAVERFALELFAPAWQFCQCCRRGDCRAGAVGPVIRLAGSHRHRHHDIRRDQRHGRTARRLCGHMAARGRDATRRGRTCQ